MEWGYAAGLPRNTATAWGCRAAVNDAGQVVVLPNNVSSYGPHITHLLKRLVAGGHEAWQSAVVRKLADATLVLTEDREHILYQDDDLVIKGNALGSGEYLNVCAYHKAGRRRLRRRLSEESLEDQYTPLRHKMLALVNLMQYTKTYGSRQAAGTYRYRDDAIARHALPAAPFGSELSTIAWLVKHRLATNTPLEGQTTLANAYEPRPGRRTPEGDRVLAAWTAKYGNPLAQLG